MQTYILQSRRGKGKGGAIAPTLDLWENVLSFQKCASTTFGAEKPAFWGGIYDKIKISSTHNLLCRKCRKIATSCIAAFLAHDAAAQILCMVTTFVTQP